MLQFFQAFQDHNQQNKYLLSKQEEHRIWPQKMIIRATSEIDASPEDPRVSKDLKIFRKADFTDTVSHEEEFPPQ